MAVPTCLGETSTFITTGCSQSAEVSKKDTTRLLYEYAAANELWFYPTYTDLQPAASPFCTTNK